MRFKTAILHNERLTEQERLNLFLYNNKEANKEPTTRSLINLSIFAGPTWSDDEKRNYYSPTEYRARNWWDQQLIEFDRPGWWNGITGWEEVGLYAVIEKHGPFFFQWKYLTHARTYRTDPGRKLLPSSFKPTFSFQLPGARYGITCHKALVRFNVSALYQDHPPITKGRLSLVGYTMQSFVLYSLSAWWFTLQAQQYYTGRLTCPGQAYIVFDYPLNLTNTAHKKHVLSNLLINKLRNYWVKDNTHYLNTIEFRVSLLTHHLKQLNASLLSSFYAQQMSLIAARRTQRWFLRDIKRFNGWLWIISLKTAIRDWQLTTFQAVQFNTKGRIIDARRVFSRQHIYGDGSLPSSKQITPYNAVPSYAQACLTTKWGSTNLRILYYDNPLYHTPTDHWFSYRQFRRYGWHSVFLYKLRQLLIQHRLATNNFRKTSSIAIAGLIGYRLAWQNNQLGAWLKKPAPVAQTTVKQRTADQFIPRSNRIGLKLQVVQKVLRHKLIKTAYYSIKEELTNETGVLINSPLVELGLKRQLLPHLTYPQYWFKVVKKFLFARPITHRYMYAGRARYLPRHKYQRRFAGRFKAQAWANSATLTYEVYKSYRQYGYLQYYPLG